MRAHEHLRGRRILVVEDETLIAMLIEDMLLDLGCVVLGPIATLGMALTYINEGHAIDVALVDLNLCGELAFPIADLLKVRRIPMVLCTGNAVAASGDRDQRARHLQKPYRMADLASVLTEALSDA